MKYITLIQILVLLSMMAMLLESMILGIRYRKEMPSVEAEHAVLLTVQSKNNRKDKIALPNGSYYLGKSIIKGWIYPNYIRVRHCFHTGKFQLLMKVDKEGLEVSVLEGTLETTLSKYKENTGKWIRIPKFQTFFVEDMCFEVI